MADAGTQPDPLRRAFNTHPRHWRTFQYVYPVISRRSSGLSLGVNLNPDQHCTFNCVYCSIDRSQPAAAQRAVDLGVLERELDDLVAHVAGLFAEPEFRAVPPAYRVLRDIAFSGDGEPTLAPEFPAAVEVVTRIIKARALQGVKPVLITNACCLARAELSAALERIHDSGGEIWAKLDAGTEAHYQRINRSRVPLSRILDNLAAVGARYPLVIQSLFARINGSAPAQAEIAAYVGRLKDLLNAGAQISLVQVYTVARPTAHIDVRALDAGSLAEIAAEVRKLGIAATVFV